MNKTDQLVSKLGYNQVKLNENLALYTYMKVGGSADILFNAETTNDLILASTAAQSFDIPTSIIGNGANILVSDKGIRGLVIINKSKNYKFLPHDYLEADSGVNLVELINQARIRKLTGLERLLKVPATVGGAIFMNAGDTGKNEFIGDLVRSVRVLTPSGQLKSLTQEQCQFSYRGSRFQISGELIISAILQLKAAHKEDIEEKAKDILIRKINQPSGPSVGSTFRNPPDNFAGKLLEQAGVKGLQVGGAKVSEKHANFILNLGNATAGNIKDLINQMKSKVKKTSGIELVEEVRYLGDWSE